MKKVFYALNAIGLHQVLLEDRKLCLHCFDTVGLVTSGIQRVRICCNSSKDYSCET